MNLTVGGIKKEFNNLCDPAQFYLVLSIISGLIYLAKMLDQTNHVNTVSGIFIQVCIVLIWSCVLNWVCRLKYGEKIAWFLVFLPFILIVLILIIIYHAIDTMNLNKGDLQELLKISENQVKKNKLDEDDDNLIEGSCSSCSA